LEAQEASILLQPVAAIRGVTWMGKVRIEANGEVAILRLDNGATNPLGEVLVRHLQETLDETRNKFKAIVLAGNTKFFSIGLDLPTLMPLNRTQMTDFWHRFNQVVFDLFTLPLPTVCAITGHAIAGGTILSLTSDYRIAAEGKLKFGLTEVKLGVPVPYLADMILREVVGERAATEMLYNGNLISVSDAQKIGLVDGVYPREAVENEAVMLASKLAALPQKAFAAIKSNRVEQIRNRNENSPQATQEIFLDCWFSDPTRELLKKACEAF
jgi:enoyl-CoA hydratase/carnithine racemase